MTYARLTVGFVVFMVGIVFLGLSWFSARRDGRRLMVGRTLIGFGAILVVAGPAFYIAPLLQDMLLWAVDV